MLSLFKNNRGARGFYGETDGEVDSISPSQSPRGLSELSPNTSFCGWSKAGEMSLGINGKENRGDGRREDNPSSVTQQENDVASTCAGTSLIDDGEKDRRWHRYQKGSGADGGRRLSSSASSSPSLPLAEVSPTVVLSYAVRRYDHLPTAPGCYPAPSHPLPSSSSTAPSGGAGVIKAYPATAPGTHTNNIPGQQRCQRCWQVFPVGPLTSRSSYTCLCCCYAICPQCRCPVKHSSTSGPASSCGDKKEERAKETRGVMGMREGDEERKRSQNRGPVEQPSGVQWKCTSCIRPGMTMMRFLETTKGGKEVVLRLIEFCDPQTERTLKSLFRFASLYSLSNNAGFTTTSSIAGAVEAAVERAVRWTSLAAASIKGREGPPVVSVQSSADERQRRKGEEEEGRRGGARVGKRETLSENPPPPPRDSEDDDLLGKKEESMGPCVYSQFSRSEIQKHLARMEEESPAPIEGYDPASFPPSNPRHSRPLLLSPSISVSPNLEREEEEGSSSVTVSSATSGLTTATTITRHSGGDHISSPNSRPSSHGSRTYDSLSHPASHAVDEKERMVSDRISPTKTSRDDRSGPAKGQEKEEKIEEKRKEDPKGVGAPTTRRVERSESKKNDFQPSVSPSFFTRPEKDNRHQKGEEMAFGPPSGVTSNMPRKDGASTRLASTSTSTRHPIESTPPGGIHKNLVNGLRVPSPPSLHHYPSHHAAAQHLFRPEEVEKVPPSLVGRTEEHRHSHLLPYGERSESPAPRSPNCSACGADTDGVKMPGGVTKGVGHPQEGNTAAISSPPHLHILAAQGESTNGGFPKFKEEEHYFRPTLFSPLSSSSSPSSSFSSLPRVSSFPDSSKALEKKCQDEREPATRKSKNGSDSGEGELVGRARIRNIPSTAANTPTVPPAEPSLQLSQGGEEGEGKRLTGRKEKDGGSHKRHSSEQRSKVWREGRGEQMEVMEVAEKKRASDFNHMEDDETYIPSVSVSSASSSFWSDGEELEAVMEDLNTPGTNTTARGTPVETGVVGVTSGISHRKHDNDDHEKEEEGQEERKDSTFRSLQQASLLSWRGLKGVCGGEKPSSPGKEQKAEGGSLNDNLEAPSCSTAGMDACTDNMKRATTSTVITGATTSHRTPTTSSAAATSPTASREIAKKKATTTTHGQGKKKVEVGLSEHKKKKAGAKTIKKKIKEEDSEREEEESRRRRGRKELAVEQNDDKRPKGGETRERQTWKESHPFASPAVALGGEKMDVKSEDGKGGIEDDNNKANEHLFQPPPLPLSSSASVGGDGNMKTKKRSGVTATTTTPRLGNTPRVVHQVLVGRRAGAGERHASQRSYTTTTTATSFSSPITSITSAHSTSSKPTPASPQRQHRSHRSSTEALASSSAVYARLYGNLSGSAVGRVMLSKKNKSTGAGVEERKKVVAGEAKVGDDKQYTQRSGELDLVIGNPARRPTSTSFPPSSLLSSSSDVTEGAAGTTTSAATSTPLRPGIGDTPGEKTPVKKGTEARSSSLPREHEKDITDGTTAMTTGGGAATISSCSKTSSSSSTSHPVQLHLDEGKRHRHHHHSPHTSHSLCIATGAFAPTSGAPNSFFPFCSLSKEVTSKSPLLHHVTMRTNHSISAMPEEKREKQTKDGVVGEEPCSQSPSPPSFTGSSGGETRGESPTCVTTTSQQDSTAPHLTSPSIPSSFSSSSRPTIMTTTTAMHFERVASLPNPPLERCHTAIPSYFQRVPSSTVMPGGVRAGGAGNTTASARGTATTESLGPRRVRGNSSNNNSSSSTPLPLSPQQQQQQSYASPSFITPSPTQRIQVPSIYLDPEASYHSRRFNELAEGGASSLPSPSTVDPFIFGRYNSKSGLAVLHPPALDVLAGIDGAPRAALLGTAGRSGGSARVRGGREGGLITTGNNNSSRERHSCFVRSASALQRTPTPLRTCTPLQRQQTLFVRQTSAYPKPMSGDEMEERRIESGRGKSGSNFHHVPSTPPTSRVFPHAPSPPLQSSSHPSCPDSGHTSQFPLVKPSSDMRRETFEKNPQLGDDNVVRVIPTSTITIAEKSAKTEERKDDVFARIPTTKNFERLCSLHPPCKSFSAAATASTPQKKSIEALFRERPVSRSPPLKAGVEVRIGEGCCPQTSESASTRKKKSSVSGCSGTISSSFSSSAGAAAGKIVRQDAARDASGKTGEKKEAPPLSPSVKISLMSGKRIRQGKASPAATASSSSYLTHSPGRSSPCSSFGVFKAHQTLYLSSSASPSLTSSKAHPREEKSSKRATTLCSSSGGKEEKGEIHHYLHNNDLSSSEVPKRTPRSDHLVVKSAGTSSTLTSAVSSSFHALAHASGRAANHCPSGDDANTNDNPKGETHNPLSQLHNSSICSSSVTTDCLSEGWSSASPRPTIPAMPDRSRQGGSGAPSPSTPSPIPQRPFCVSPPPSHAPGELQEPAAETKKGGNHHHHHDHHDENVKRRSADDRGESAQTSCLSLNGVRPAASASPDGTISTATTPLAHHLNASSKSAVSLAGEIKKGEELEECVRRGASGSAGGNEEYREEGSSSRGNSQHRPGYPCGSRPSTPRHPMSSLSCSSVTLQKRSEPIVTSSSSASPTSFFSPHHSSRSSSAGLFFSSLCKRSSSPVSPSHTPQRLSLSASTRGRQGLGISSSALTSPGRSGAGKGGATTGTAPSTTTTITTTTPRSTSLSSSILYTTSHSQSNRGGVGTSPRATLTRSPYSQVGKTGPKIK